MSTTMTSAAEQADALHALADMIGSDPALAATGSYMSYLPVWWAQCAEQLARIARAGLAHGAQVDKIMRDDVYIVTLRWGSVVAYAYADRGAVCKRIVTGTHEVTKLVPDPKAPRVEITETVEDVRWECVPLLASAVDGAA